jgi:hypothetical protein
MVKLLVSAYNDRGDIVSENGQLLHCLQEGIRGLMDRRYIRMEYEIMGEGYWTRKFESVNGTF